MHTGIHTPKQQTQMETWLQLISVSNCSLQKLTASTQVPHLVGTGSRGGGWGGGLRLESAAYRIALDVELSETLFCHLT
jgi:hypothetical protein